MKDEKTIVIDINLTRGRVTLLALALLTAAFVGYLAWGQGEVAASGSPAPLDHARDRPLASSAGMRQYYLTTTNYTGGNADGAGVCANGYHFASLWEILDPASLKYNTALGYNRADSGQGPPSYEDSWVRTGYASSAVDTAGRGNCYAWGSSGSGDYGTTVRLPRDWTTAIDIHIWDADTDTCNTYQRVWCVED